MNQPPNRRRWGTQKVAHDRCVQHRTRQLKNALECAVAIIRNEAGLASLNNCVSKSGRLSRWADELIDEGFRQ